MLDTVRVKFPIHPTCEQLIAWKARITKTVEGEQQVFIYNPVVGETTLRFTYYPRDYKGNPLLTLECSLPKLIFDNNYQMLGSIDGTIKIVNMVLEDVTHVPR